MRIDIPTPPGQSASVGSGEHYMDQGIMCCGGQASAFANAWVRTKQESGTVAEADHISGSTAFASVFSASSKLATPMTATRRYSSPFRTLTDAEPS